MPKEAGVKNPPVSGYMLFTAEERDQAKEENPDIANKVAELSKVLGAKWNALDDDEKAEYNDRCKTMKEEHEQVHGKIERKVKKKKGDAEGGEEDGAGTKKTKKKNTGPKRPTTAYFYFMAARRAACREENPDVGTTDIAKILGSEWKELDDADKEEYNELAAKDKERYEQEKAALGL